MQHGKLPGDLEGTQHARQQQAASPLDTFGAVVSDSRRPMLNSVGVGPGSISAG